MYMNSPQRHHDYILEDNSHCRVNGGVLAMCVVAAGLHCPAWPRIRIVRSGVLAMCVVAAGLHCPAWPRIVRSGVLAMCVVAAGLHGLSCIATYCQEWCSGGCSAWPLLQVVYCRNRSEWEVNMQLYIQWLRKREGEGW